MDIGGFVGHAFEAATRGAASVYHEVVATGVPAADWAAQHPAVLPLIETGLSYAGWSLARFGVPVGAVTLVAEDIATALKMMAAGDATVPTPAGAARPGS